MSGDGGSVARSAKALVDCCAKGIAASAAPTKAKASRLAPLPQEQKHRGLTSLRLLKAAAPTRAKASRLDQPSAVESRRSYKSKGIAASAAPTRAKASRLGQMLAAGCDPFRPWCISHVIHRESLMHRLAVLVVSSILTLLAPGVLAADKPAAHLGEQRAEAFLEILSAPAAEKRTFVQENFTQAAIEQRGLDSLVQFLARVREDLSTAPPRSVRALGDRVEFGIGKAGGENLRFTVMLGPPPASLTPDTRAAGRIIC
jgi:hypothetical protein